MSFLELDEHGQPLDPRIGLQRRIDRGVHEILGLCKGVLADGVVVESEARYLNDWLNVNPELAVAWPLDVLARRMKRIFADGVVDAVEREDLAELLREITGGRASVIVGEHSATELPIDKPPPPLEFVRRTFVFTGKFALGPRQICEDITHQKGAHIANSITKRTDYLVIGSFGSAHWAHTSFGRKIMRAAELRDANGRPTIISEDHWADHI